MSFSFGLGEFLRVLLQRKSLGNYVFSSGPSLSSMAQLRSCSSPKGSFLVERKGERWKRSSLSRVPTLRAQGLQSATPCLSPGKNTGVGCRFLLQGAFLFRPRDGTRISCIAGRIFFFFGTDWATVKEEGAPRVEAASALLSLLPASFRMPFAARSRREWKLPYVKWVPP